MKKKALYLALGLVSALSLANSASAASVDVTVVIQQAGEDGTLIEGTQGSKTWDLSDEYLWESTTQNGHTLNELIPTNIRWKNGGAAAQWGSAAEFYVNDLSFDVDPMLSFDFTLQNNTAFNQTYSIYYNTPLLPNLSGLIDSSASLTAELTDRNGSGARITPANGNGNIMRSWDITVNQNQIAKNVDVGSAFSITSGMGSNTWSAVNTLICGSGDDACEVMSTVLTLTLSKGDSVRLYGNLIQEAVVPAPASFWLFGSALGLIAARVRRRKV